MVAVVKRLQDRRSTIVAFDKARASRPIAPPWAENAKPGDKAVGVASGPDKTSWQVAVYQQGRTFWYVSEFLGTFSVEIEAVMFCREEAIRRGLPRLS